MIIWLRVRRLFCDNAVCSTRTFAEQIAGLTRRYARRTGLLRQMAQEIGLALAGRAGARLAARLGVTTSRHSLLRLVRALPDPPVGTVEVLGVDDFALRRGHVYGTVLLDITTHRVLDMIEGRTAAALAGWLTDHAGVAVICRDRSGAYADGARIGAPDAIQVADRYHLWANLGEAVERTVRDHRGCLAEPLSDPAEAEPGPLEAGGVDVVGGTGPTWPDADVSATAPPPAVPPEYGPPSRLETRTHERHAAITELRTKGYSLNAISRELGLAFRTVQRFARAATAEDLLACTRNRPSHLDQFKPHLHRRWNTGTTEATVLHAELTALGWHGSLRSLQRYLRRFRDPDRAPRPAPPAKVVPAPRRVARAIMTDPANLGDAEQVQLTTILARCPELAATAGHVHAFATMMCRLEGERLPAWMAAVEADDLPALHSLVSGLRRDQAAVTNGLRLPYNSGQVEGTVNKIKMIKRQMFGRAKFDLLRKRILLGA